VSPLSDDRVGKLLDEIFATLDSADDDPSLDDPDTFDAAVQRLGAQCYEFFELCKARTATVADVRRFESRMRQLLAGQRFPLLSHLTQVAFAYLDLLAPDAADSVLEECHMLMRSSSLSPDERDFILNVLADADEEVGRAGRAGAARSAIQSMTTEESLDEYIDTIRRSVVDFRPIFADRPTDPSGRLLSLISACQCEDDASEHALVAELLLEQARPERLALGWRLVALCRGFRNDLTGERNALARALGFSQEGSPSLTAKLLVRLARVQIACGDVGDARETYRLAVTYYAMLRQASGDPLLRIDFSRESSWAAELMMLGVDVDEPEYTFCLITALQSHGLAQLLKMGLLDARDRGRGDGVEDIMRAFVETWEPHWHSPRELAQHIDSNVAMLHLALADADDEGDPCVVVQLLRSDSLTTRRTSIRRGLLDKLLPVSAASLRRLRQRDWNELAEVLLPDDVRGGHLDAQRLVIAPHGVLASLPFGSLPAGASYLAERFDVAVVPELALWTRLPRVNGRLERVVYVGVDVLDDPRTGVSGVRREIASLRDLGAGVTQVRTFAELSMALPADMLVLAVHGLLNERENSFTFPSGDLVHSSRLASLPLPPVVVAASCWTGALASTAAPFAAVPAVLG
jgi:hypothetical protein